MYLFFKLSVIQLDHTSHEQVSPVQCKLYFSKLTPKNLEQTIDNFYI